ncbi:MAG: HEAT repeat domain-containing protein [Rhodothermales bacterium]
MRLYAIATFTAFLMPLLTVPLSALAQDVMQHPDPSQSLSERWTWATEQASERDAEDGYWIGYSIERRMRENSFIGSWSDRENMMTLGEALYGVKPENPGFRSKSDREVTKEVAILFLFEPGDDTPTDVQVSNMEGHADLDGHPVLWLGPADKEESLEWLEARYDAGTSTDAREELVAAIGIHGDAALTVPILRRILTGDDAPDVREQAAFWLGQTDDEGALALLMQTTRDDPSEDVREHAVFAIGQMDRAAATDSLVYLAQNGEAEIREQAIFWLGQGDTEEALVLLMRVTRTDPSADVREHAVFSIGQMDREAATDSLIYLAKEGKGEVREQAIFWLGQEASERATEAIGEVVRDDPDTEVQKKAVFALTQLPEAEGIPLLIDIARTHPKTEVRKQAIFWLGQSEDERAVEVLIDLVRN